MWILRRRKRMQLRRMMLRRKTDPKTGKHTWREHAQPKCALTWQEHFDWKFTGKAPYLCVRACAVEMRMDISQEPFCIQIYRENAVRKARDPFCASLRSRNAHGHFTRAILCRNLQGKCRTSLPRPTFCVSLRSRHVHGHVTRGILWGIYRKNAKRIRYHLDWTPALGYYRKNPSVWPHCLGKKDTRSDSASSLCQDLGRRGSL